MIPHSCLASLSYQKAAVPEQLPLGCQGYPLAIVYLSHTQWFVQILWEGFVVGTIKSWAYIILNYIYILKLLFYAYKIVPYSSSSSGSWTGFRLRRLLIWAAASGTQFGNIQKRIILSRPQRSHPQNVMGLINNKAKTLENHLCALTGRVFWNAGGWINFSTSFSITSPQATFSFSSIYKGRDLSSRS